MNLVDCVPVTPAPVPAPANQEGTIGNEPNAPVATETSAESSTSRTLRRESSSPSPPFISGSFNFYVPGYGTWEKCPYRLEKSGMLEFTIRHDYFRTNITQFCNEDARIGQLVVEELPQSSRIPILLPSKHALANTLIMIPRKSSYENLPVGLNDWMTDLWIHFEKFEGLVTFVEFISKTVFKEDLMFNIQTVIDLYDRIYRRVFTCQRTIT